MDEKEQKKESNGDSNDPPKVPPIITEINAPQNEENGDCSNNSNPRYEQRGWEKKIAIINTVFNGFLMVGTWLLYMIAANQSEHTKDAANAAKQSAISANDANERMKEQFKIDNRPFIIVSTAETVSVNYSFDEISELIFWIKNAGKYPAKVVKMRHVFFGAAVVSRVETAIDSFKTKIKNEEFNSLPIYSTNNSERIKSIPKNKIFKSDFPKGQRLLVFGCEIYYQDLINKKDFYVTEFCISIEFLTAKNLVMRVIHEDLNPVSPK